MTDQLVAETLSRFRAKAAEAGVSSRDVELLISSFLPAVYPVGGDGPVVVHLGGNTCMLPVGADEPSMPFLCSIDCAQIPPNSTGLPLPADGHLLLFGDAEMAGRRDPGPGYVVYVPAGTPTTEVRAPEPPRGSYAERIYRSVRVGPSWPSSPPDGFADPSDGSERTVDDIELLDELREIWEEAGGNYFGSDLYIGGHADSSNDDPVALVNGGEYISGNDWCLLANWYCDDVVELPWPRMHWLIRRQDLADLRFDRVMTDLDIEG